jgi:hypothetical protein
MSNLTSVFAALVIGSFCAVGAIGPCNAFPGESGTQSLQKLMDNPVLQVKKKNKCIKVFECDYFAPATACSTPPCCKKGHWEKNCENAKTQQPDQKTEEPQKQTQQPPQKTPKSDCSQPVPPSMEALARQTCNNNHSGSWMNCSILEAGPNGKIQCCCNWLE